jgi:hypothetical protein
MNIFPKKILKWTTSTQQDALAKANRNHDEMPLHTHNAGIIKK